MALNGTIRDFGVADILQLISQQVKTGMLVFKNDVDEVRVWFKEGCVVRAESEDRPAQTLLGALLVRSEMITQEQLDLALEEQQRTLKLLGVVLVDLAYLTSEQVSELVKLQMTETIYGLFTWKNGTYEFDSAPVDSLYSVVEPLRAENIVMNGIRMMDEWPVIREKLPSYTWTVERVNTLPPAKQKKAPAPVNFSAMEEADVSADLDDIGNYERMIYNLIAPGRDVQKLIDLARIGEFEACRALSNLMSSGYVRVFKPSADEEKSAAAPKPVGHLWNVLRIAQRMVLSATLVIVATMLVGKSSPSLLGAETSAALVYTPQTIETHLAASQIRVIRRALEVYRIETGAYPDSLDALVSSGILQRRDLSFPYEHAYLYLLRDGEIVLLPPMR